MLATMYNASGRMKRPVEPRLFNPYAEANQRKVGIPITAATIQDLRVFL